MGRMGKILEEKWEEGVEIYNLYRNNLLNI